jgi:hypothetical protein
MITLLEEDQPIDSLTHLEYVLASGKPVRIMRNKQLLKTLEFPDLGDGKKTRQVLVDGLAVFSLSQIIFHLSRNKECLQWSDGHQVHKWF